MKMLRLIVFACSAAVSACMNTLPPPEPPMDWAALSRGVGQQLGQLPKH